MTWKRSVFEREQRGFSASPPRSCVAFGLPGLDMQCVLMKIFLVVCRAWQNPAWNLRPGWFSRICGCWFSRFFCAVVPWLFQSSLAL